MFIDTHCHMTDPKLANTEEIISRMHEMNVKKIITSGFDPASSIEAVKFAEKHDGVYASIGIYPCEVDKVDEDYIENLRTLAKNKKVVAIGEVGLELREGSPDFEIQKKVLIQQLQLANELHLPLVFHCREAIGKMLEILKENKNLLTYGGTFHCFTESKEVAMEILKLGLNISFGGVSTFKNAKKVQDAVEVVPLEKILLETDSPYLAPEPFRSKLNTPAFIPYIAQNIAKIKGVQVQEVAEITTKNAEKLFKI